MSAKLYRHFDADGALLYIGISMGVIWRTQQHINDSHWSDAIARIDIQTYPTLKAALDAEQAAIHNERPLYNVIHNGEISLPYRRPRSLTEAGLAELKRRDPRREIPDPEQPGLYIIPYRRDRRWHSYAVRYRFKGKTRKLTLPRGLTLWEARQMAVDIRCELAKGKEPASRATMGITTVQEKNPSTLISLQNK